MCLLFPNFYVFHWWILNKEINDWLDLLLTESQGLRNRLIRVRVQGKETPQYSGQGAVKRWGTAKTFWKVFGNFLWDHRRYQTPVLWFCSKHANVQIRNMRHKVDV